MPELQRRQFTRVAVSSLLTYGLLETLFSRDAFGEDVKPIAAQWLRELHERSAELKGKKLSAVQWQSMVEKLFARVDLSELLTRIDFGKLEQKPLPDKGARHINFRFVDVEGLPTRLIFGKQVFGLKKGRSVVPHGHDNMATAFLILKGKFEGKLYDRLEDVGDHIIIRPTIDRAFGPGDASTISDEKDNVHWFKADHEGSYILNIHVLGVSNDFPRPTGRVYLDPNGEKLAEGKIRAPRISYEDANRLYG